MLERIYSSLFLSRFDFASCARSGTEKILGGLLFIRWARKAVLKDRVDVLCDLGQVSHFCNQSVSMICEARLHHRGLEGQLMLRECIY